MLCINPFSCQNCFLLPSNSSATTSFNHWFALWIPSVFWNYSRLWQLYSSYCRRFHILVSKYSYVAIRIIKTMFINIASCWGNFLLLSCCGSWGDDTPQNCTISHKLGNCEMAHQYPKDNKSYTVGATYCNVINQNDYCCSTLSKIITVTNWLN